jgi:hypothetical protein
VGNIWVREFTGGLDTRRMYETTPGGSLIKAVDCHITRGGEVEKRAAFVPVYTLPEGATVGMAAGVSSLCTFGSAAAPSNMPVGVTYQRLQHPVSPDLALARILSSELYAGKLYVVAEFEDGSRFHYYNGVRVEDWYDGRARTAFAITAGSVNPAVSATAAFTVTGGTASSGLNRITSISIDSVALTLGAIKHTGNNETTALAVATAINAFVSTPNYAAYNTGPVVTIVAPATGTAYNGLTLAVTVGGDMTVGSVTDMAGGADASVSEISDITVDSVSILGGAVVWADSNEETANRVANAINSATTSPDYIATFTGATVNVIASDAGTTPNGYAVELTTANGLAVLPASGLELAGGKDPDPAVAAEGSFDVTGGTAGGANIIDNIAINNVSIISSDVPWATSHAQTASDIADAINATASVPNYTAVAADVTVTVTAAATGPAINGKDIVVTVGGNVTIGNAVAMAGGVDEEPMLTPGTFVKTVGSRMTAVAGSLGHGSGLSQPTKWTTDTTGAFVIDMSTRSAGSEELTALALYQSYVAMFAERVIQMWAFDSDPNNNEIVQVLNNTGTAYPKSVTSFGDNDLFYADESGVRSLRARDSSNAAATTDIGVPIDTIVTEKLATTYDKNKVVGLIEPRDGRFWLSVGDTIYVFSFFAGSKISAWSEYTASTKVDGQTATFNVDEMCVFGKKVYLRSGDTIYAFGGLSRVAAYDETQAEVWLPYLDASTPTTPKAINGLDAALEGQWQARLAYDPVEPAKSELVATLHRTTYADERIGALGRSTHISPRFITTGSGYARLGSVVVTYEGDDDAADAG